MSISDLSRRQLEDIIISLDNRLKHLLHSETVRLFDEKDAYTGEYKRDIKQLDTYGVVDKLLSQEKANHLLNTRGEEITNAMRAIAEAAGVLLRCVAEADATPQLEKGRGS